MPKTINELEQELAISRLYIEEIRADRDQQIREYKLEITLRENELDNFWLHHFVPKEKHIAVKLYCENTRRLIKEDIRLGIVKLDALTGNIYKVYDDTPIPGPDIPADTPERMSVVTFNTDKTKE